MIARLLTLIAATGFASAAFAWLVTDIASAPNMYSFLLLHLLASFGFAAAVWRWLPAEYRRPGRPTFAFLVLFCIFTPGLGACGIAAIALVAPFLGVRVPRKPFRSLHLPEYCGGASISPPDYGAGGFRLRLLGKTVAAEARMKTILLVQALPGRLANDLWRSLLSDRLDDIRLVAYQALDAREKSLNRSILERDKLLEREHDPKTRRLLIKQLSELSWEMLYDDLAQGAVADFIRARLGTLLQRALEGDPDDPDLWLLQGRLALSSADFVSAEHALAQSLQRGMPRTRAVPYIAELAFERGEWKRTRELMRSIPAHRFAASLAPQAGMWQDRQLCR